MSGVFSTLPDGRDVHAVTLRSEDLEADIVTYGARLNGLRFRGSASLVPTHDLDAMQGSERYAGAIIGPVMNRISGASAPLGNNGLNFQPNEGKSLLHSGYTATFAEIWNIKAQTETSVTLICDLPDGAFPGNRTLTVQYALQGPELNVRISATSDKDTLMAPGFHPYWTLSGQGREGHDVVVHADRYLPTGPDSIPTGVVSHVGDSRFDLRQKRSPSFDIDHCFDLAPAGDVALAVSLSSGKLQLDILTDAPGVHLYTGDPSGIAVEPEMWPDAPNQVNFTSIALAPGHSFEQRIVHRFSAK